MYYIAKALEVLGMFVIAAGFIMKFPGLMDPKLLQEHNLYKIVLFHLLYTNF